MKLVCIAATDGLTKGTIYFGQILRYEVGGGCCFLAWNDRDQWQGYDLQRFAPPEVIP